jgi:predicted permease
VLAVQYRRDVVLSVELVALTTLSSIVTMPLVVALADTLLSR